MEISGYSNKRDERKCAYTVSLAVGGILTAGLIFYFPMGWQYFGIPACVIYENAGMTRERLFRGKRKVSLRFWKGCVLFSLLILAGNTVIHNIVLFVHRSNIISCYNATIREESKMAGGIVYG